MADLAGIEALLERYFDALYTSDAVALGEVLHPRAIYATADEEPPLYRTTDEYLPIVAKRESPASRGEPRRDFIDNIAFAGENTASAQVRCGISDRDFTDFLSLVREGGEWRIIAKVFHFTERACPTSTSA